MVQRVAAGPCSDIQQDADVGVQGPTEGIEEPSMGVEFLQVILLQAKDHLAWYDSLLCAFEFEIRVERNLGRVLVNVGGNWFLVDHVLCNAVLVDSHCCERIKGPWVHLLSAIRDDADYNLLPAVFAPSP